MWTIFAVAATALPSCVVTSTPTFQEPDNCPPIFLASRVEPPIPRIVVIDPTASLPEFRATVPLVSCGLAKVFEGRVFIDGRIVLIQPLEPNGESLRYVNLRLPVVGSLSQGCHRVELLASSAFVPGDPAVPVRQDDLADVVWFVNVRAPTSPDHPIENCPQ
ncbi:MAG: hypothetical protein NVS3B10_10750 [Polyangiales bacterium]